jgi:hypothetical protein
MTWVRSTLMRSGRNSFRSMQAHADRRRRHPFWRGDGEYRLNLSGDFAGVIQKVGEWVRKRAGVSAIAVPPSTLRPFRPMAHAVVSVYNLRIRTGRESIKTTEVNLAYLTSRQWRIVKIADRRMQGETKGGDTIQARRQRRDQGIEISSGCANNLACRAERTQ